MEGKAYNTLEQLDKNRINNLKEDFNDFSFTQCADCAAPAILRILSTIKDVAIIIHSPTGCAASFADFNRKYRNELKRRRLPIKNPWLVSTNLNESDVICGIDKKLEDAIDETINKFNPKAIFIAASCGSGVTGYDIQQVIDELKNKISIPIVTIVCEIYGSKKWGSGFNGYKHGVLKDIVQPIEKKDEFYNIIDFSDDYTIKKLLNKTDVNWNYISCYCDYECLEKMAHAKGTFLITTDRFSKYIANWLESEFKVPNINIPIPCGFEATDLCLKEIGKVVKKEEEFNKIILKQREIYEPQFKQLCKSLKGIRVLPIIKGNINKDKMDSMLNEFNIKILDIDNGNKISRNLDKKSEGKNSRKKDFNRIKHGYQFMKLAIIMNPDIIIAQNSSFTACGARMGYPTFWMDEEHEFFGYEGMFKFGYKILSIINNRNFYKRLSQHTKLPYSNWIIEQ